MSRAITIHGHRGLDVLRLEEIPDPPASAGRAVVGRGAEYLDIWVCEGWPGLMVRGPTARAGPRTPGPGDRHGITRILRWNETRKMPCIALADLAALTPACGRRS